MIPKRIIEKAVEGGWTISAAINIGWGNHLDTNDWSHAALDSTFWKALGKELGWDSRCTPLTNFDDCATGRCDHAGWNQEALRFYDLILTGQSTDKFWEEIYPSKS